MDLALNKNKVPSFRLGATAKPATNNINCIGIKKWEVIT